MGRTTEHAPYLTILLSFLLVLFCICDAHANSSEEILHWVASQMDIESPGKIPEIRFVDKNKLCAVFKKNNQKSYLRWKARYGVLQAKKILSVYLREIIGLFDPDSKIVYVANDLAPCRQQSILAHELTHFFQYKNRQIENHSEQSAEALRLRWEMEAQQIESRFIELHCPGHADK